MAARPHLCLLVLFSLALTSCSSGPPPVQKGTPPYYWQGAGETYASGDYMKAIEHLSNLLRTQNEFTARAYPWSLVLNSGMAKGCMEIADAFENGARQSKANPTPFRRQMSDFRTRAGQLALQFLEQFQKFDRASKDEKIPLAFSFPTGNAMPVAELSKAGAGMLLQEGELASMQRRVFERAVLMAACRAVGASEDPAKAREAFKPAEIPRATFLMAMANAAYEQSQLYSPQKLDQPDRRKLFLKQASDILDALPDSKEKADLGKKVQAALKGVPK